MLIPETEFEFRKEMFERLTRLETSLDDFKKRLFNGEGTIPRLGAKVTEHSKQIESLRFAQTRQVLITGAIAATIGALFGAAAEALARRILHA